jgi:hypothetical protein
MKTLVKLTAIFSLLSVMFVCASASTDGVMSGGGGKKGGSQGSGV